MLQTYNNLFIFTLWLGIIEKNMIVFKNINLGTELVLMQSIARRGLMVMGTGWMLVINLMGILRVSHLVRIKVEKKRVVKRGVKEDRLDYGIE